MTLFRNSLTALSSYALQKTERIRSDRELWEIVAQWKEEGKRKSIITHLADLFREINDDLNGDIFKPRCM